MLMSFRPHPQEVTSELELLKMSSDDLTLRFFADLAELQEEKVRNGEKDLGELLVSVEYSAEKESLDVLVIQGNGLPVMDKAGECAPEYWSALFLMSSCCSCSFRACFNYLL